MAAPPKKVVVVGGGFAGFFVAQRLEKQAGLEVVLIEPKDYFFIKCAL